MHTDQTLHVARRHDGQIPASWRTGGTDYQKAAVLAAYAWHEVKPPDDPDLANCDITFRENLIGICESIIRGNLPDDTPFAQRAAALWSTTNTDPLNKEIAT